MILDGTVVRVPLDRKATNISLLVVLGVRRDGQKVLLAAKNGAGESEAAWRSVLDDLIGHSLRTPEFVITDGGAGLDRALAALWPDVPAQRCTVHTHRNLLAHAPDALHEEVTADDTDMIYAETVCSPSSVCPRASGSRHGPRTRSSACTRSSSAGSRRKPCCRLPKPPPCCSGRSCPRFRARSAWNGSGGATGIRPDHHAQGQRMANLGREARRPCPR